MKRYPNKRSTKRKPAQPAKLLRQGTFVAEISELLTDGRGFATFEGKPLMITGALPGETVKFHFTKQTKQLFEGEMVSVVSASDARVVPKCPVFTQCGGCVLQHLSSDKQIDYKQQQLVDKVNQALNKPAKQVVESLTASHWGYRHRARVGLKWQKNKKCVDVGFRGRASSHIVPTKGCDILAPALSALFPELGGLVENLSSPDSITHVEMTLAEQIGQGENGHSPQISLTFRHVEPLTSEDKENLTKFADTFNALIYLQSDGDDSVVGLGHDKTLSYFLAMGAGYAELQMDFMPYHFTQVNFTMNRKMVEQALDWLNLQSTDTVLDLFCGLGNFSLPIAQRVAKVVGVEGAQSLVTWAKQNAENNGIDNAEFYQADLTQNTQMMAWRVKYSYNKVLIDPPRAGAADMMPLLQAVKPERICYVSCHGATLARDIQELVNDYGYRLEKISAMDMFPQTAHVEAMALLVRK